MQVTQAEKEKYLQNLNEDSFRELIVRRLFKALGFKDGRDTCGPEEYGKDAIFVETDKFGEEQIIAVQTKTGSITLAADPTKNLHTILAQLQTALNHPHVCISSKTKRLPSAVYLIASGTINQAARSHIQERTSDPRLKFLDRNDLIARIDEHRPEIWSGITAEISPYFKSLSDKVEDLSFNTSDLNQVQSAFGAYAGATDYAFIDPLLSYQAIEREKRNGRIREDLQVREIRGSNLFKKDATRALILGDAGSGKTTLLIRLAYLIAKSAIISTKSYRIPVYARALDLVSTTGDVFAHLANLVVKNHALTAPPFQLSDFEQGRAILLIDGLDELALDEDRQKAVDFSLNFANEYPTCSLAITTRPYSSIERIEGLKNFKRYKISPLSLEEASRMLQVISGGKGATAEADWQSETLRKLEGVHGVELSPLLVTVFALSSRMEKRDVPANITELFSKFTELMLGRWDEKKGLNQQYQSKVKDSLVSDFAFQLHSQGESAFLRSDFVDFASKRLNEINLSADVDLMVSEILNRSGLFRGDSEIEFRHHLLQEYFASKGIANASFIREVLGDDWWQNSIVFYFGASPRNVDILLDVATSNKFRPEETFVAVGLALQACYLSRMEDRVDVWKLVNWGASSYLKTIFDDPDQKYPLSAFLSSYLSGRDSLALSGIEDPRHSISDWCHEHPNERDWEITRFWYAVGLSELGKFSEVLDLLKQDGIKSDKLLTALHFGCYFASKIRSLTTAQRTKIETILKLLKPAVAANMVKIMAEFKGQLLEYRRGGVVALDEPEPDR